MLLLLGVMARVWEAERHAALGRKSNRANNAPVGADG